jgi:ketosteroid isomerase-like protein
VTQSANVERMRSFIAAFNARDLEAFIAHFDPSAEFQSVFAAVGGAVYHGHDELPTYFRDLKDAWGDEIRIEPEAYFDLDEHTLLFLLFHGRGRQSGAEVAMPVALVARWRGGLMVHLRSYTHRAEALSALGVSEGELVPIDP